MGQKESRLIEKGREERAETWEDFYTDSKKQMKNEKGGMRRRRMRKQPTSLAEAKAMYKKATNHNKVHGPNCLRCDVYKKHRTECLRGRGVRSIVVCILSPLSSRRVARG